MCGIHGATPAAALPITAGGAKTPEPLPTQSPKTTAVIAGGDATQAAKPEHSCGSAATTIAQATTTVGGAAGGAVAGAAQIPSATQAPNSQLIEQLAGLMRVLQSILAQVQERKGGPDQLPLPLPKPGDGPKFPDFATATAGASSAPLAGGLIDFEPGTRVHFDPSQFVPMQFDKGLVAGAGGPGDPFQNGFDPFQNGFDKFAPIQLDDSFVAGSKGGPLDDPFQKGFDKTTQIEISDGPETDESKPVEAPAGPATPATPGASATPAPADPPAIPAMPDMPGM